MVNLHLLCRIVAKRMCIPSLLLRRGPSRLQDCALQALVAIQRWHPSYLISAGALPLVVKHFAVASSSAQPPASQALTVMLLERLTKGRPECYAAVFEATLRPLVSVTMQNCSADICRRYAHSILAMFAEGSPERSRAIIAAGALDVAQSNSDWVQSSLYASFFTLLDAIAQNGAPDLVTCVAAALQPLVSHLQSSVASCAALQERAALSLPDSMCLTSCSTAFLDAFLVTAGALPVVTSFLLSTSYHARKITSQLLHAWAVGGHVRGLCAALAPLVSLLSSGSSEEQHRAVWGLKYLAAESIPGRKAIVLSGALPALCALLRLDASRASCIKGAIAALKHLVISHGGSVVAGALGLQDVLEALLEGHSSPEASGGASQLLDVLRSNGFSTS